MFPSSPRLLPSLQFPTFESLAAEDTVVIDWFSTTRICSPEQAPSFKKNNEFAGMFTGNVHSENNQDSFNSPVMTSGIKINWDSSETASSHEKTHYRGISAAVDQAFKRSEVINWRPVKPQDPRAISVDQQSIIESQASDSAAGCLSMTHRRGRRWTTDEDALLLSLIDVYGQDWRELSARFPGKSAKQIKERYLNQLDRRIIDSPWSSTEDFHLVLMIRTFGRSWCRIANEFPGRTELMLKNRYHSFLRKKFPEEIFVCGEFNEGNVKRILEKAVRRGHYDGKRLSTVSSVI
jgi:Myb-like DNA-binding domain